jgi:hypothetical protein
MAGGAIIRVAQPCGCVQETFFGAKREKLCEHRNLFEKPKLVKAREEKAQRERPGRNRRRASTPQPSAPRWLTEGFALGVDQREAAEAVRSDRSYGCWFAQFDPFRRPCADGLDRCHIVKRQRVEKALAALLPDEILFDPKPGQEMFGSGLWLPDWRDVIQLAAWDPRNARIGCTGHHPRFDSNATPRLYVPFEALPEHVLEFAEDWGLEPQLERQCPKRQAVAA